MQKRKGNLAMVDEFSFIKTTKDRDTFIKGIDELTASLYSASGVSNVKLPQDHYSAEMLAYYQKLLTESSRLHPNVIRETLSALKKKIMGFLVLKVTLSFEPSSDFYSYLSSFFTESLNHKVVLDCVLNPAMGGGITIETKGLYKDYSLSKVIDNVFSEHREEIGGMIG